MFQDRRILCFGELLMRLSSPRFQRFAQAHSFDVNFGGAEANVAVALRRFGLETDFFTVLPDSPLGERAISEMRQHGLSLDSVMLDRGRLGLYFLENGAGLRGSQVIYDRVGSAISSIRPESVDWEQQLSDYDWLHWSGITPALSETAAELCRGALLAAERMGLQVSVDLNYRSKLWNYGVAPGEVMPGLVRYCDVIIGNELDAERMLNIEIEGKKSRLQRCVEAMQQIKQDFERVEHVALTMRTTHDASSCSLNALYLHQDLYRSRTIQVPMIVDRIGGGDAFTAAFLYGLQIQSPLQQRIDFAVAASAFKHTIPGDLLIADIDEINQLLSGDGLGRVQR